MSEHHMGVSEQENTSPMEISQSKNQQNHSEAEDRIAIFSSNILDRGDSIIYAIVGVCFFLGALFALGYSFWDFGSTMFNISGTVAEALKQVPPVQLTQQAVV